MEKLSLGTAKKTLNVVKDATGYALPGQTTFIMGASGAGKTSLLNIISKRVTVRNGAQLTGDIKMNDVVADQELFGRFSAYVMQDDILFEYFTVRESLRFAARLKLNAKSIAEQNAKVELLLQDLGLLGCADTLVGSAMKKTISGGERKRTAIGVELVTDPSLLLLDEPTSGLDSFKATSIVRLLNSLARNGKTVVATIHQPSS
mmetsp:Transcript_38652/g.27993  ORF Transcript_38652/g.27993 Transcript_38652/m.27993 type:complete len:204 (+) Transcript_38652:359-970(+)